MSTNNSDVLRGREAAGSPGLKTRFLQPRHAVVLGDHHRLGLARQTEGFLSVRCEVAAGRHQEHEAGNSGSPERKHLSPYRPLDFMPVNAICPERVTHGPNGAAQLALAAAGDGDAPAPSAAAGLTVAAPQLVSKVAFAPDPSNSGTAASYHRSRRNEEPSTVMPEREEPSTAMLMRIAGDARVFRGLDLRFYAEVPSGGHHEIVDPGSPAFEYWLIPRIRHERKTFRASMD
jgi:hypothetical protein